MESNATVMLVDDHPLFRRGLRDVISLKTPYKVVAEADNGETAITLARIHNPSITIIDLALPDCNGLYIIRELKRLGSHTKFIVLTLYNDMNLIEEALEIGAAAYLMKSDGVDVIENCLSSLADENVYISPSVSVSPPQRPLANADHVPWQQALSNREKHVLQGVAKSQTSREIAETLALSPRTVQNHRARIIRKLGLEGTNALYRFALQHATQ